MISNVHSLKCSRKIFMNEWHLYEIFCFFTTGAALKGKNLLPFSFKSSLYFGRYIILGIVFKNFQESA